MSNVKVRFCFIWHNHIQFRNNQWMEWISSEVYDGIQKLDFSPGDEFKISYWENVVALQIWPQAGINGKHKDSIAREKFEGDLTEISQWKLPNAEVWFLERSLNSRQKQWESVALTAERLMINFIVQMSEAPSGALTPLTNSLIF